MKFTDGQWLVKSKHEFLHPVQVFSVTFNGKEMVVYSYTKPVVERAKSLDQASFTLRFTTQQPDTITVKSSHFEGMKKRGPAFTCKQDMALRPVFEEDGNSCSFSSGKLKAVVFKNPFSIAYYYDGKLITASHPRAQANIVNAQDEVFMREQLSLAPGEYVYGLGERFTAFLKNGQTVDMWNEDGGTASELTYKNIPFYVTNKNYGIFVNHPEKVSFEVASEQVERVQFSIPGHSVEYVVIGGGSIPQVIANYNRLTGKPALPPAWSFGLWLSTSFTTSYDEATVNSFIDGMAERELPLHVFHFDCFWMQACEWCNFTWDPETFPDPPAMLARLKKKGLKICVWINPYIAQKSSLFEEAKENHYLLERPNGDVWQWDRWQAGMGIVDFTNPDAWNWYQQKLKALLDMGVDCFKTDFGERIPTDAVYHDGSDPVKMHNYYTYLYNKCVFELLVRERGEGDAVLFARSATTGSQQFPIHWGGDCWGTYESMAESLRGGLSLCMSGFGFWSHDIGGFEKTAPADVYKRWVAFGLLSTHSRLHGSSSYRVPWLFDEEAVDVLRFFTNLRCQLMPYLWEQANHTAQSGVPMMRSMVMEFNDAACKYIDSQYMLGEKLLVAPIFNAEGKAEYYLPKGRWVHLLTGECREGGRYYEEPYNYFGLPLYMRPGCIVPIGENKHEVEYKYNVGTTFHVAPLADGGIATSTIYAAEDASVQLVVSVERNKEEYAIYLQGKGSCRFLLYGVKEGTATGAVCAQDKRGLLLTPEAGADRIVVVAKTAAL